MMPTHRIINYVSEDVYILLIKVLFAFSQLFNCLSSHITQTQQNKYY